MKDEMFVCIYNEKLELLGKPYVNSYQDFIENPTIFYPQWQDTYYATAEQYEYPIIDLESKVLRDMTREEKILNKEMFELLEAGEYIENKKLIKKEYDVNLGYLEPDWNKEEHIWYEKATIEEKEKKWVEIINSYKPTVLEGPFPFIKDGVTYYQKLRVDKDVPLVSSTLSTLTRHPEIKVKWAFDDENNDISLGLEDIERLQDTGVIFTNAVYDVERDLKAQEPNLLLTIEDYKKLVEEKLKEPQLLLAKGE